MVNRIDMATWERREHFEFFSSFEEPFFGITANVECTNALQQAKSNQSSFFLIYLYRALKAANSIEAFRLRINEKNEVVLFDELHASPTIGREDHTFGFSYMDYDDTESGFISKAQKEIDRVKSITGLGKPNSVLNVIHFSSLPWICFTALSHARMFSFKDSIPKISFGQYFTQENKTYLPVSVHVHHGLADGYHVGLFLKAFEDLLQNQ